MCGIVGGVNWGSRRTLEKGTSLQAHRGPDDSGVWDTNLSDGTWVGLGNQRLAIIDLSSAGHMPMASEDGKSWITYNGEIYNLPELRSELIANGHQLRSRTDTEVILHLYQQLGVECLSRLNGMFAFAIWDGNRERLFLARDHFGVKPLYYYQKEDRLAFGSEVKALLALTEEPVQVDLEALHQYLTFLWVPDPLTMFKGIHKLPAGHFAIFQNGALQITKYWDISFPESGTAFPLSEGELTEALREKFLRTVKAQRISDVPLGAFLSAGMDSSSIVAMLSETGTEPPSTYTIAFPPRHTVGQVTLDDTAVARRTAAHFGCRHTEIVVEPDVVNLLPKLVWHADEPIADPAIITAYLVCREARKQVTVLLSGIGGDEVFAGYRKHVAQPWAQRYRRLPDLARRRLIEPLILSFPSMRGTPFKDYVRLAKKAARSWSLPPAEGFLMSGTYFTEPQKAHLYTSNLQTELNGLDPWRHHRTHFDQVGHADFLNQMLYVDSKAFMPSLNLTYNDKMSMASSVEVRVPFLDRELVEFVAWQIPPSLKVKGTFRPTTKYILRKAMKGILPAEVLTQPKAGFGAPLDHWLSYDLKEMVDDLLSERVVRDRDYFKPEVVRGLVEEHRSGRQDWSFQIWQLLTLELWLRTFVDTSSYNTAMAD